MFWKGSRFPGLSPAGTTHRLFSLPGSVSRGGRRYPLTPQVKGIPPVMGVSILSIYRPPRGRSHPEKRAGNAAGETQRLPVPLGTRAGTRGRTGVPEGRRLPLQVCRWGEEASETGEHGGRAAGGDVPAWPSTRHAPGQEKRSRASSSRTCLKSNESFQQKT